MNHRRYKKQPFKKSIRKGSSQMSYMKNMRANSFKENSYLQIVELVLQILGRLLVQSRRAFF